MTSFEELEAAWKAQSAKLDQVDLLLTDQVWGQNTSRIKAPLRGLIQSLWFEVVLSATGMLVIGSFLADHITQARFVWPAALMDVWLAATLITAIRQLISARKINFDKPIADVQQQLARLRVLRLRTFRWLFLSGQVVWWMPFLILSLRMVFGVDAYRYFTPAFISVNMVAGLALIPVLLLVLRRFRFAVGGAWYEHLADVIAGQSLAEAQQQAQTVADFIR
jgi:hypothetical protein